MVANEELGDLIVGAAHFGEMFGDEKGVVKAAFADVPANSGEGDYRHLVGEGGKSVVYEFG